MNNGAYMSSAVQPNQLSQQYTRRSASKQQHLAPNIHLHPLNTVRRTRGRLDQNSFEIREVANRMHKPRWIPAVSCESAGHVATECGQILA
jgi:hypothetical protein